MYAISFKDTNDYIDKITNEGINLDKISLKTYLLQHCCFLKITKNKKYNIKYYSTNIPYKYLHKHNFGTSSAIRDMIYTKESDDNMPYITKLRGVEREYLEKLIYFRKNNSMIDKIINI